MILTKTPVRIPLAGGGTDLPLFTKKKCWLCYTNGYKSVYLYLYLQKNC